MESNKDKIGNWGKWGVDDERGCLNYLSPEVIKKAIGMVKRGVVYNLAISWHDAPPQEKRGRPIHLMRVDGGDYAAGSRRMGGAQISDDFVMINTHGVTHIDALCHVWFDDLLYNGFSGNTIRSSGARYCGIDKMGWLISRGILLDIVAYKGVRYLEKGYVITPADLEGCASTEGIDIEQTDALLIRTGWLNVLRNSPTEFFSGSPGIGMDVAAWAKTKHICVIGSDTFTGEVSPPEDPNKWIPVHEEIIRNQGAYIMELMNLDDLAKARVYSFLFVVAPLNIPGGTASPVSPLAIT